MRAKLTAKQSPFDFCLHHVALATAPLPACYVSNTQERTTRFTQLPTECVTGVTFCRMRKEASTSPNLHESCMHFDRPLTACMQPTHTWNASFWACRAAHALCCGKGQVIGACLQPTILQGQPHAGAAPCILQPGKTRTTSWHNFMAQQHGTSTRGIQA